MPIHVDIHERVGVLTLDRPERANSYDTAHLTALADGVDQLIAAGVVAAVVRSSGDRAFCGGADLNEMKTKTPADALDLLSQRVFNRIADAPFVSIVAIQGAAVAGGFELALACDIVVVGPAARMSLPETKLGLIPAAGGCTRLPQLVGPSVAKHVILAGRTLSADDAVRFGLAIGCADEPFAEAMRLARQIASVPDPVALRLAKQAIDQPDPDASLAAERVSEALLYARRAAPKPDQS